MSFTNRNICRSFKQDVTTTWTSLTAQVCSEVIIVNKTGADDVIICTANHEPHAPAVTSQEWLLENDDSMTFRGLTNANQVSAKKSSGNGNIYYRTQYWSHLIETVH